LSFDGSKPLNAKEMNDLLEICRDRDSPIDAVFPETDFSYLEKHLVITKEQIEEQKEKALIKPKPCTVSKNSAYIRPANSTLDNPCILSVDKYTTAFPEFLSSEEIKSLGAEEIEDETYVPDTVALDYNADDAPYIEENADSKSIASLNFPNSVKSANERHINPPSSPSSVRSLRNINFEEDSSMSKKRAVASILRRARSERSEFIDVTPDSPISQRSSASREKHSIKSAASNKSKDSKRAHTKRIISPYHQELTADNIERHSWEFPGEIEIHFDDGIWKEAASDFAIQNLYDDIRGEKAISSPKSERKSVSSKKSKRND